MSRRCPPEEEPYYAEFENRYEAKFLALRQTQNNLVVDPSLSLNEQAIKFYNECWAQSNVLRDEIIFNELQKFGECWTNDPDYTTTGARKLWVYISSIQQRGKCSAGNVLENIVRKLMDHSGIICEKPKGRGLRPDVKILGMRVDGVEHHIFECYASCKGTMRDKFNDINQLVQVIYQNETLPERALRQWEAEHIVICIKGQDKVRNQIAALGIQLEVYDLDGGIAELKRRYNKVLREQNDTNAKTN